MHVSEDGSVVGSIDRSRLGEIDATSDEAKAQVIALQSEAEAGAAEQERLASERQPEEVEQETTTTVVGEDVVEAVEGSTGDSDDDLDQLRAEAEAAGVKVDKRWGADRLRTEIEKASEG